MAKILIVDDKEENLYLLRALLHGHGHEPIEAHNGSEALERAAGGSPDLVVSDILMPVMDGFTLCRRWKQDPVLKKVPFVFYTATYTEPKDEQLALSLGADRFIVKPVEPDEFLASINQLLEDHRRGRVSAREGVAPPEAQYLREYNEVHVHKLEDKLAQLEDANRALAEKDAFNQAVLNAMTALVAVLDPHGRVLAANEAWKRFAARPQKVASLLRASVGDDVLDASEGDPQAEGAARPLRAGLREVLDGRRAEVEAELPATAEGAERWFLVRVERVAAEGAGAVVACIDITDRKRAEHAVREASRRKDEFLGMLGHELRNPLAPIMNASYVLKQLRLGDGRAERAREIIERQVFHLARIVDDLLDLSRIARGKLVVRREPTDLSALVRTAVADHRPAFEARGLQLVAALPATPVWVRGDATRLTQIIGNLLGNAQKFTERGRVEIRLSDDDAHGWAVLRVADTGIGMSGQTLERLFQPFEQAPQGSARTRGGFGMGLALVKGLVELHGGEVDARSAGPGLGSQFRVRLPLAEAPDQPARPAAARPDPRGSRILVIEDNRDAAESLRTALEMAGCTVQVAFDGPSGLEIARRRPPATVLCDIGLPGTMDGYAVARAFRAEPALRSTRLIALTGYGQQEDRRRAQQAGFDSHVTKPADPDALLDLLGARPEQRAT